MKLPEHSHCKFCGDPIRFGDDYCSDDCGKFDSDRKKKEDRKINIILLAAAVIIIGLFVLQQFL